MSWVTEKKYYAPVYKMTALADCAISGDYSKCLTPLQEDGSPYKVYDTEGNVAKSLPLVYRPPVNVGFPCHDGYYSTQASCAATQCVPPACNPYYLPRCPRGSYLLDGRGPCVSSGQCRNMGGIQCNYNNCLTKNPDSCYVKGCGKGLIPSRCPEAIVRNV